MQEWRISLFEVVRNGGRNVGAYWLLIWKLACSEKDSIDDGGKLGARRRKARSRMGGTQCGLNVGWANSSKDGEVHVGTCDIWFDTIFTGSCLILIFIFTHQGGLLKRGSSYHSSFVMDTFGSVEASVGPYIGYIGWDLYIYIRRHWLDRWKVSQTTSGLLDHEIQSGDVPNLVHAARCNICPRPPLLYRIASKANGNCPRCGRRRYLCMGPTQTTLWNQQRSFQGWAGWSFHTSNTFFTIRKVRRMLPFLCMFEKIQMGVNLGWSKSCLRETYESCATENEETIWCNMLPQLAI